jgi:ATP-dependent Clp protease ATP-binding subunit ClpB
VIIMTSNVGSQYLTEPGNENAKSKVMSLIKSTFKPELLNRITDIVIFDPLSKKQLHKIVAIQLKDVGKRLQDRGIDLKLSEQACDYILQQAYDPLYGARPLRRYLERLIVTELAKQIVSGGLLDQSIVHILVKNEASGHIVSVNEQLCFQFESKPEMEVDH